MEYGKIIAVTGLPGLFELLSSKSDGAIVRSLDDKTTKFVSSRVHNFSHLESIEVFTVKDNVNLSEVFTAMNNGDEKLPDGKDGSVLKKYFEKVFPDLDFERVYSSDLKKMVKWFTVLKDNQVEIKVSSPEDEEVTEEEKIEEPTQEQEPAVKEPNDDEVKPKKTAAKKKASPKVEETTEDKSADETEAKPVKKAAKKKKSEE